VTEGVSTVNSCADVYSAVAVYSAVVVEADMVGVDIVDDCTVAKKVEMVDSSCVVMENCDDVIKADVEYI
jgi:hypothetical protein